MRYFTLAQLRFQLGIKDSDTGDDPLLRWLLGQSESWLNKQMGRRHCDPRRQARVYSGDYQKVLLDDDLQALISVTNGDGTTVAGSEYYLDPANEWPKFALALNDYSAVAWLPLTATGSYRNALTFDGVWFYHNAPSEAWADTLDTVQDDPLAADATVLSVANADGAAADSLLPRFQVDNLLRFGSAETGEYANVVAVDTVGNTVTLQRAVAGTTAAAHLQDTPIYVFRPWGNIQAAMARVTTFSFRSKDGKPTERISVLGNTQQIMPGGIPEDVMEYLPGLTSSYPGIRRFSSGKGSG